ncbi:helix-turn-helix domain-containing protein [Hymenobacter chitinivorans]|uniref:Helix-turn-helix protein n=1 Tax=Hymenobacter chitinivorans DSM 11115 TaxID=1121954 RepID=A0A2M9B9I8_9BACT|nr:helix-turn-helix protein [Hymenobacter chitinivorans DSM 11115]
MGDRNTSSLLQEIARRLKALRESQQRTLQEVYDATGIHIARIEARRQNVTLATLAALCQYYHTSLSDFLLDIEQVADTSFPSEKPDA